MKFIACALALALMVCSGFAGDLALPTEVLAEVNFARTQPQRYADLMEAEIPTWRGSEGKRAITEAVRYLRRQKPLAPLAQSEGINRAALGHVIDMGSKGLRGHYGSRGSTPWARMKQHGTYIGYTGENIAYGIRSARTMVMALIADDGVSDRGHRKNIFNSRFLVAGVAHGSHSYFGNICVMDFASGFSDVPEMAGTRLAAARQPIQLLPFWN